jgi:plasmid stabilization system protein ParE
MTSGSTSPGEPAAPNARTAWWTPSRAVFTCSPHAYVIFYRIEGEDVFILHVLDGRRDIPALV